MALTSPAAPSPPQVRSARWLVAPFLAFAAVSVALGVVAHEAAIAPGSYPGGYFRLFFSDPIHLKAWFATAAGILAVTQLFTAAWIFRKLPWPRPPGIAVVHRWVGRLALAATLPVAYHCIFKLGFQTTDTRTWVHSLFGCGLYGAFAAKVLIVRLHRFPGWVLPVAGALLFVVLIVAWYTSAFWFLRLVGGGT